MTLTIGDLRRIIEPLPDDGTISIGYWTLTDLYGDQSLRAYTTSMCKDWVVSLDADGEGSVDLSLRTMDLDELYEEKG